MSPLADATATIAAWAATIVVLLLVAVVFWSFLRRRGTVEELAVSPADEVRRARLEAEATGAPLPGTPLPGTPLPGTPDPQSTGDAPADPERPS